MRQRDVMSRDPRSCNGFATVTVLGLVAVTALLCAGALHDALFGEQLAASRLLHQRAAALSDIGVGDGLAHIADLAQPATLSYALQPLPGSTDSVSIALWHSGSSPLAEASSLGRFAVQRFEIESTGHTVRGISMTQVQGVERVMPVESAATEEP
jgi:hypothetical protein